ncbi:hypothetical protein FB567DRAFT_617272 [Paraphoma chrysanthemicola]|uniref:Uncharacterized protein n=1 Tax=Paraphoma chrysanthemicola TaxID=798071 RepID=A0A8K0RCX2_9PLEO|nr:hypothetical protein FB567DRAFT_617272 [Paraphoma chrysanthemicola]
MFALTHRIQFPSENSSSKRSSASDGQGNNTWFLLLPALALARPVAQSLAAVAAPLSYHVASPQSTSSENTNNQRRRTLRETSTADGADQRTEHGPVGGVALRRSNTMATQLGGPVDFRGMDSTTAEGYGTAASSSDAVVQTQETSGGSAVGNATAPSTITMIVPATGIQALIAAGSVTVSITAEREDPNTNPSNPAFLHGVVFGHANPAPWFNTVLPALALRTFLITNVADIFYLSDILACPSLPRLSDVITNLVFPKLFWFSGVAHNRRHNPFLMFAASLPNLHTITFNLHTAGITTSAFGERQMIALEQTDPVRAKERVVMSLEDVAKKYELHGLLGCGSLRHVRIEYIDCDMTRFFTKVGDPVDVLRDVVGWLLEAFGRRGREVVVELVRIG